MIKHKINPVATSTEDCGCGSKPTTSIFGNLLNFGNKSGCADKKTTPGYRADGGIDDALKVGIPQTVIDAILADILPMFPDVDDKDRIKASARKAFMAASFQCDNAEMIATRLDEFTREAFGTEIQITIDTTATKTNNKTLITTEVAGAENIGGDIPNIVAKVREFKVGTSALAVFTAVVDDIKSAFTLASA